MKRGRRRSGLLSRLRKNPVSELLLVNPGDRPTRRRRRTGKSSKPKRRHPEQAKNRPAWIRREEREEAAASRRAYGGKRRKKMARKRKWKGSRKQRAALRKMIAARKRSLRGNPRKARRGRKRRFTAKARAASLRNLRKARRARRGSTALVHNPHKRGRHRRRLKRNPMGKSWSRKTTKRIAKSRRHRHRKGWQGMGLGHRKHKKRARPAKGGAVARKRARKSRRKGRRKGYRFTKARRRALAKAQRASRRSRRGGKKSHRKTRRGKARKGHRKGHRRSRRRTARYSARTMRTVRSRRGRKGRRSRRRGVSTLRRARRYLRGRRRVGSLARSYARKWGLRSNPNLSGGIAILKKAGFALGGLMATRYLPNLLVMIPVVGPLLGSVGPLVAAVASGLAMWWLTGRSFMPGIVKGHRTEIMIGAGLGVLEQAVAKFLPAIGGGGGDLSDTWTEGTMPLADYVADGQDLGGYVPELGLGLNVEQALAGYVQEGPISQAVAGLGSAAATAMVRSGRLGSGAAWTASGPIPQRPMAYLGASYGGIFTKGIF